MHVVTATAGQACAVRSGDQRVQDNSVTLFETRDVLADLFNPAGIFMPHDTGQKLVVRVLDMAPDTFNDMKVGPAYPRRTDLDDHIR